MKLENLTFTSVSGKLDSKGILWSVFLFKTPDFPSDSFRFFFFFYHKSPVLPPLMDGGWTDFIREMKRKMCQTTNLSQGDCN